MSRQTLGSAPIGRIPTEHYLRGGWRLPEIAADFEIEDVWAFPAEWTGENRPALRDTLDLIDIGDASLMTRACWAVRDALGRVFGLGRINTGPQDQGLLIPETPSSTLADRLPADLRATVDPLAVPEDSPFTALYETDREYVSELSNKTAHALMHLVWAPVSAETAQVQMAVYVKPRGAFGRAYMAGIKPFRHLFVYPDMVRMVERGWQRRYPEAGRP